MFATCATSDVFARRDVGRARRGAGAKSVSYCNPISGLEQTFTYFDIFEAPYVVCGPGNPGVNETHPSLSDPCAAPSSCIGASRRRLHHDDTPRRAHATSRRLSDH